jgi:hypothetical protein
MDIAAVSASMAQSKVVNEASVLVMKKVMNVAAQNNQALLAMIPVGQGTLGNNVDIRI